MSEVLQYFIGLSFQSKDFDLVMGLKLKLFGKKHWNPWISCISRMKCWFTKLCYYLVRRAVRMLQRCNAWNPRISAWNAQMGDEIHWNPFYYSLLFFPYTSISLLLVILTWLFSWHRHLRICIVRCFKYTYSHAK